MANPGAGEYSRAYRLRKTIEGGGKLKPLDMAWLVDYNERQKKAADARAGVSATDVGASRSKKSRKLHVDLEEHAEAEAVGTGSAAADAAAAAVMIDAEGKRVDQLTVHALKIYEKCVEGWAKMGTVARRLLREQQKTNTALMANLQAHYLARLDSEGNLIRLQQQQDDEGDPINALMAMVAARQLGVDPAAIPGVAKMAAKMKAGGKNGVHKK